MDWKNLKCEWCGKKLKKSDSFWYSSLGFYAICQECIDNHSKIELMDIISGQA